MASTHGDNKDFIVVLKYGVGRHIAVQFLIKDFQHNPSADTMVSVWNSRQDLWNPEKTIRIYEDLSAPYKHEPQKVQTC